MAYETSKFGDGGYNAGVSNVRSNVSNHYGPRKIGGEQGVVKTEGGYNEASINFDGAGPRHDVHIIPAGAIVDKIISVNRVGAIATATVGATSIAGANTTPVVIATAGQLTVTGPTAGKVIVRYYHIAT